MPTLTGSLTIDGPLDQLADLAHEISRKFPGGFTVSVEADALEVAGYTVDRARTLLRRLAARQREAIETVVEHGGRAEGDVLRAQFANEQGQIRGLTGPISKHVKRLIAEGVLPEGTEAPTKTEYDPDNASFQRAGAIEMDAELVPIFREALKS